MLGATVGRMRVAIEGNVGSGKSTCVEFLKQCRQKLPCDRVVSEPVDEWHDWLSDAYAGAPVHLGLQVAVILSYADLRDVEDVVCERSPATGMLVFVKQLRLQGRLTERDEALLSCLFHRVGWTPDAMVHIRTSPEVCLRRVRKRNRAGEELMSLSYLRGLADRHDSMMRSFCGPVITVDGDGDIEVVREEVLAAVQKLHRVAS